MQRTLEMLRAGESGVVGRVDAHDAKTRRRLMDMGLTPGVRVRVQRVAPLGDPIEVALRGYRLSLRREDARRIALHPATAQQSAAGEALPPWPRDAAGAAAARLARELTADALRSKRHKPGGSPQRTGPRAACAGCPDCRACPGSADRQRRSPAEGAARKGRLFRLAIAGNPNCGKTTLFNALTGARECVGNWPGVTVEKKEGRLARGPVSATLIDLPGIYSLSARSQEELVARGYILAERPDLIINIVDAANLERNLYLSLQLIALGRPVLLALNMMDEAETQGISIDCEGLAAALGVPVAPICARTGQGLEGLLDCAAALMDATGSGRFRPAPGLDAPPDAETLAALTRLRPLCAAAARRAGLSPDWTAARLLEGDAEVFALLEDEKAELRTAAQEVCRGFPGGAEGAYARFADGRYRQIAAICAASVRRRAASSPEISGKIDAVLAHRWMGLPLFALLMGGVFLLTFDTLGAFLSDGVERLVGDWLAPRAAALLARSGVVPWLTSLLCDGVLAGVGSVLTFLPQIALLFFFLSLLEDSGYLARAAFLMDRALQRFGLSGKAFIPMLMGFGCTVPAAMSARTMENEGDKRMTILLLPFVSCSAKLPVYGLIASAFFGAYRGWIVLSLYLLGLAAGVMTGALFRRTLFRENRAPFVLELPPYRLPSLKNTLLHVGERTGHFLKKAGTVILLMSVLLWALMHFDMELVMTEDAASSILGRIGGLLAPLFAPLGFSGWQAAVALLTGLVAKEAVIASLSLFLGVTGEALPVALQTLFTPLSAYCFLVFVLLYSPCIAALATMRRELRSLRYTLFLLVYQTGLAYLLALLVRLLGQALPWLC